MTHNQNIDRLIAAGLKLEQEVALRQQQLDDLKAKIAKKARREGFRKDDSYILHGDRYRAVVTTQHRLQVIDPAMASRLDHRWFNELLVEFADFKPTKRLQEIWHDRPNWRRLPAKVLNFIKRGLRVTQVTAVRLEVKK